MVRDYRKDTTITQNFYDVYNVNTGTVYGSRVYRNKTHVRRLQYRDNIKQGSVSSSVPGFLKPTAYRGCFLTASPLSGGGKVRTYPGTTPKEWSFGGVGNTSDAGEKESIRLGLSGTSSQPYPKVSYNLESQAQTELLLKLNNQELDLGAFFADAMDTSNTIARLVTQIALALKFARRGNLYGALNALGLNPRKSRGGNLDLTDVYHFWLQYRYGFRPIVLDIHNAATAFQNRWDSQDRPPVLSAQRNLTEDVPKSKWATRWSGYAHRGINMKVYYTIDSEYMYQLNGLGLLNPAAIAWEAVTLSFVLDWLIPLGNSFKALSATAGCDFVAGYKTVWQRMSFEHRYRYPSYSYKPPGTGTKVLMGGQDPGVRVKGFAFTRTPITSWPKPRIYLNPRLNLTNLISAMSLLATVGR